MKRIHYLLLGLLVSLTIAAVSPTLPPTRLGAGSGIAITTNGVNSFTLASATGMLGTNNLNPNQFEASTTNVNLKSGVLLTNVVVSSGTSSLLTVGNASANNTTASLQLIGRSAGGALLSNNLYYGSGYTYWADSAGTNILRYDNGARRTHIPHLEGPGYYRGMLKFGSALPTSENTDGLVSISQGFTNVNANVRAL